MIIRVLICAFAVALLANTASATYNWGGWGDWHGWNHHDNWDWDWDWDWENDWDWDWDWKKNHQKWWDCDDKQWKKDCSWGEGDKDCKKEGKKCGKKWGKKHKHKCDPHAVPTPTAAIAGLGVMGLMLSRRRNKQG